jgi:hypothetical protein
MLIECQSCQKKLNIADDKIPFGRPFTFTCPSCKFKNTLTLPERRVTEILLEDGEEGGDAASSAPPPQPQGPVERPRQNEMRGGGPSTTHLPQPGPSFNLGDFNAPGFDDLPEGLKSALVAFDSDEIQEKLEEKLTAMGYKASTAVNVRDAVKQLKFGRFQLVIIQEDYYGATLASNQLIRATTSLDANIRRDMFIAVIGPSFTSLDDLTAFSMSLDTVVNISDIDDIDRILISAIGHSSKFISVYREMRAMRGLEYDASSK